MIVRISIIFLYFPYILNGCMRTIPPEEVYITSTGANLPTDEPATDGPEETTAAVTVATTAGGGGSACSCPNVPAAVTQQFLDTRIKGVVANAELPETWEPGLFSCGLSVGCLYNKADSELAEKLFFLVTSADEIVLFQDSFLVCSAGKWTNNGVAIVSLGCYGVLA